MGSYNILMYFALILGAGAFYLLGLLFVNGLQIGMNTMIEQGIISMDTLNTFNTIITFYTWSGVVAWIAITIWALSTVINERREQAGEMD